MSAVFVLVPTIVQETRALDPNPYVAPLSSDAQTSATESTRLARLTARWMGIQFALSGIEVIVPFVVRWPTMQAFEGSNRWLAFLAWLTPSAVRVAIDVALAVPFLMGSLRFRKLALVAQGFSVIVVVIAGVAASRFAKHQFSNWSLMSVVLGMIATVILLQGRPSRARLWMGAILTCVWVLTRWAPLLT